MAKVGVDPSQDYQTVQVQSEKGKMLDTRLMAGPLAERGCTDIICCLLFIANCAAMISLAGIGYKSGKPDRLVAVYDADKNACGIDVVGYPYLYFAFPYTNTFNRTVCVSQCPYYQTIELKPTLLNCSNNSIVKSCVEDCGFLTALSAGTVSLPINTALFNPSTFTCIFNTTVQFSRLCAPAQLLDILSTASGFQSASAMDSVSLIVEDLQTTQQAIYICIAISFVLGIVYLMFTRVFAGVIVWLSILGYFIVLAILIYLSYSQYTYYHDIVLLLPNSTASTVNSTIGTTNSTTDTTNSTNVTINTTQTGLTEAQKATKLATYTFEQQQDCTQNSQKFQIITGILIAFIAISLFGFICYFNKLRLAIAIIKTAAVFLKDEFLIVLVPPIASIFVAILWIWWLLTAIYIYATGVIKGDGQTPFATVTLTDIQKQYLWYFTFGGLWVNALIQAVNDFVIASTCCIWYFSQGTGQGAHRAIRTSLYRAFRYHLGSLAFGSLILAIVQIIRITLAYIKFQLDKVAGNDNKVIKCAISCLSCCMACFERFIKFLNRQAYIQIALTGKSFCPAAKDAFETIWANAARYSLVGGIGGAFILVGKLFISVLTTTIFYYMITKITRWSAHLFSPILPCILVFVAAYAISVLFMSIYGMACDTILACFIFDEDLNKQNGGNSAQHCPETLRDFFEMPILVQKMKEAQAKQ